MHNETADPFAVPAEHDLPPGRLALRREHLVRELSAQSRMSAVRPRFALIGALVLCGAIATPAFGLPARIRGLFEGTPSPPAVNKSFTIENEIGQAQTRGLRIPSLRWPQVDPSSSRGVLAVPTSNGTLHLWAANQTSGNGVCWFISWADDEHPPASAPGGATGGGSCSEPTAPRSGMSWGYGWGEGHLSLDQINGYVYPDAVTVTISLADGTIDTLPVAEHLFLGVLPRGSRVTRVQALDSSGTIVADSHSVPGQAP